LKSGSLNGLSDAELLSRFAERRDKVSEAEELAFATLVARHGAMVWRVCCAVLDDRHESEDAFQATFLVLATRARSIRRGASVGSWLHGVALRVSNCARSRAGRRKRHERRRTEMIPPTSVPKSSDALLDDDSARVLHEEIGRLPNRFREVVVLCYLEGSTHEMAADQLACPVGTIRSRLATARERLRSRLIRRGVAPAAIPAGLSSSGSISVMESIVPSTSVPSALIDATVRGALRITLGKNALTTLVSDEAVVLMDGALRTMLTTRLTMLTTTVLFAGLVTAGAGVGAYATLGQGDKPAPGDSKVQRNAQKPDSSPPAAQSPPPQADARPSSEVIEQNRLRVQENAKALLRDYEKEIETFREAARKVKTPDEAKALRSQAPNTASYAGALLQLAEQEPGTAAAEEGLIWIVTNLPYGSMAERAKEMIARDHIRSDKIEPLFNHRLTNMAGSVATERLFRGALAKNPDRQIQGLACYYLAQFLEGQASFIRLSRLFDPAQLAKEGVPIQKESWGHDYNERLNKLDPHALEREAESLYQRAAKEFGNVAVNQPADRLLPGRPETLGAAAQIHLHVLQHLGIGQPAPEIAGVDLDGRPMKLSHYRGRVVALYFCGPTQLQSPVNNQPAPVIEYVRKVAARHADDRFTLLGVSTGSPGPRTDLQAFKSLLKSSGLPARFWWDQDQNAKPGPIQTAWTVQVDLYLLDHHGVIRYKHVLRPELLEKAITTLLKEQKDESALPEKKD